MRLLISKGYTVIDQRPLEVLLSYVAAMALGAIGMVMVQQYISFKMKKGKDV